MSLFLNDVIKSKQKEGSIKGLRTNLVSFFRLNFLYKNNIGLFDGFARPQFIIFSF